MNDLQAFEMDEIRAMVREDVDRVVEIHLQAFMGFFLSSMGGPFLRALYLSILDDRLHIALVYVRSGRVVGFVAGTASPRNFYKRVMLNHVFRFTKAVAPLVVRQLNVFVRLLKRLAVIKSSVYSDNQALLMSIAVPPTLRRTGIGSGLVDLFIKEAAQLGCRSIVLTTDAQQNDEVNLFYKEKGFFLKRVLVMAEGRSMNEYEYDIISTM